MSLIQLDAFKKLLLVQLLAFGKVRLLSSPQHALAHLVSSSRGPALHSLTRHLRARSQAQPLPKYTTSAFGTAAKALCAPYAELASAFATLDRGRVAVAAEKGRDAFEKVRPALVLRRALSTRRAAFAREPSGWDA